MAMFMLHLKCAVQYNPEVVWIFSSRLQNMCVARTDYENKQNDLRKTITVIAIVH